MMTIIIKTLGEFSLYRNGEALALPKSKRTRALLAYLALTAKTHRRDRLSELLWDAPSDPRGAVRWALSKIRAVVNEPTFERLVATREHVTLEKVAIDIDIDHFDQTIKSPAELSVQELEEVIEVLREPFLDGLDLPDQDLFQQWLMSERNKIKKMCCLVLSQLATHPTLTQQEQLDWSRAWLEYEPYSTAAANAFLLRLKRLGFLSEFDKLLHTLRQRFRNACISWEFNEGSSEGNNELTTHDSENKPFSNQEIISSQKIRFCKTGDGVNIAYSTIGDGYPIVKAANWLSHLKHDWNAPIWSPLFQNLATDHYFLRYDERGNGLSDWNVKDLTFSAFVEDLETVVASTNLGKFALLGISQGASVSIEYAIRHPERVSHLILFGGYAAGWRIEASEELIKEREAIMTLTATGWGKNNPAYRQIFSSTFLPSANKEELDWFNEFQRLTTSAENAVRFLSVFGDIDVREQLKKVSVPTLVMHSLGDQRIPIKVGRELATNIPNAEFVGLESDGHLLLGREPASKVFVDTVRSFIANN